MTNKNENEKGKKRNPKANFIEIQSSCISDASEKMVFETGGIIEKIESKIKKILSGSVQVMIKETKHMKKG